MYISITLYYTILCYAVLFNSLLKAIVAKWYDDMSRRDDPIAHSLLTTLYRYLCGYGDALLKDPALHRVVYILMSKLFKRLMGQLRKLGTEIVHANFSRVIINTKKHDQLAASEYVEFILSALRSNSMFSYLEVSFFNYFILLQCIELCD